MVELKVGDTVMFSASTSVGDCFLLEGVVMETFDTQAKIQLTMLQEQRKVDIGLDDILRVNNKPV